MDTIVALSSGRPPAAIGVVRVSGPAAVAAAEALVGTLPPPRQASLRHARDREGDELDRLLVIAFPGPSSATGEDLVELHCHGGIATVAAVTAALLASRGVRRAEPGEFTRRALTNGRIDLAQAEGLADLLEAETEAQRRSALAATEGRVSEAIGNWMSRLAAIGARIEAAIDFAEEDDVAREAAWFAEARTAATALQAEMRQALAAPPVERIRDGLLVVIAGPPNAGKSTLLNLLSQSDAAIVSATAGTTRDRIEVPVRRGANAYRLIDTAGLTTTDDPIESIGVDRAGAAIAAADLLLWLGDEAPPRPDALWVHSRSDQHGRATMPVGPHHATRSDDVGTIDTLWEKIGCRAEKLLPSGGELPLAIRHRAACELAVTHLSLHDDLLIAAEQVRSAGVALGGVLGVDATETMLDSLFTRFCIGK